MKNPFALALVGLLAGSALAPQKAAPKASSYVDAARGFSLDVPRFPGAGPDQNSVAAVFSGVPQNGFTSNVNVTVQAKKSTPKDFRELSQIQFRQIGLKVNADLDRVVSGHEAVELDYAGTVQGKALRFLSLAVMDKDRVVLVTCTVTPEAFAAVEPEFRACLASFKVE